MTGTAAEEPQAPTPAIGADEWVASHAGRREGGSGLTGAIRREVERIPVIWYYVAFTIAAACVPFFTSNGYVLRVGFDTLIYMLLALGLNVVVGFAGLLDLGYIAFFGFGAYGYAMLASSQFGLHWPTPAILVVVTAATAILGFLVALPSRRLLGDYLAIVTLFFGQLFVTVTQNGESISILGLTRGFNITNGPNGIANLDPFHLFGHQLETLRSYYWVALFFFIVVLTVVYLVNVSRTGRAWRSLREDSLAAELMGMPVNRLKLYAFAFGAGVAGLTGTLFASLNTAVFSSDFDTPVLILVYAILILGGAGSLGGVILGALVVNISLELLRTPNHATWMFFILVLGALVAKLRPWWLLGAVLAATVAFGFVFYGIVDAIWPSATTGHGGVGGELGRLLDHWIPVPGNPATQMTVGNWAFVLLIVLILVLTIVCPLYRNLLLPVVLYLSAFVWDVRLSTEPSTTRLIMIGVILIVLMNARPQGLVGQTRVEIV
jgi:ABC-type branched-subunit amino acid transport system permease subunit